MSIVFVTFDEIGYACLEEIINNNVEVNTIITLEDELLIKMSGNKSLDSLAQEYNIELIKARNINDKSVVEKIKEKEPDVIFIIGWSQLIKKEIISIPKYGCIGAHPTLLPKHRGRAPIPWAIINGLSITGVTFFYIDEGVDSGDIIDVEKITITEDDNATSLYYKVLNSHVNLVRKNILNIISNNVNRIKQDNRKASYWPKRIPSDGIIDWDKKSNYLNDWIRGLSRPYPGAFTFFKSKKIVVWKASKVENFIFLEEIFNPGEIVNIDKDGILVKTGDGVIKLIEIEKDGVLIDNEKSYNKYFNKGNILG